MYDYDWIEEYAEPSEVDRLFSEFRDKCMDILCGNVKSEINAITSRNLRLEQENNQLKKDNQEISTLLLEKEKSLSDSKTLFKMFDYIKGSLNNDKIYSFFDMMFEKDFVEDVYETPLWIGILTQYYSHKDEAIEFLRLFGVKLPDKIESFILPIDWTESELDVFFDTMHNHVNCNGCVYKENLRFWALNSLMPVEDQCRKTHYDEIPWQYVLRNPLLKKEKYLKQIGSHLLDRYGNWTNFSRIDIYQKLEPEELKIILDNMQYQLLTSKNNDVLDFIERCPLELIENKNFLNNIYGLLHDSYAFIYQYKFLELPLEYQIRWCKDHRDKAISLLSNKSSDKKVELTEVQRKEFMKAVLE